MFEPKDNFATDARLQAATKTPARIYTLHNTAFAPVIFYARKGDLVLLHGAHKKSWGNYINYSSLGESEFNVYFAWPLLCAPYTDVVDGFQVDGEANREEFELS